jgi:hypothetical protein
MARLLLIPSVTLCVLLTLACTPSAPSAPNVVSAPGTVQPAATEPTLGDTSPTLARPPAVGIQCGRERWPVKTLSDRDARNVNFNPVPTTVRELRALRAPSRLPQNARITPTEVTMYTVQARVLAFKLEEDMDVHLVVSEPDDPAATMIVEFPDAAQCTGAVASAQAEEMRSARLALVATFGQPAATRFVELSGLATITGVAFFDSLHGQRGVAPNGIELHPVLGFSGQNTALAPR